MGVDVVSLAAAAGFTDPQTGIRERFIQLELGGATGPAVVTEPLASPRSEGWVICHSFGLERITLHRLEVLAARALAAAGFPVLRFDCPGYAESMPRGVRATLRTHLRATEVAVSTFPEVASVETVSLAGARFGALVAAMTADAMAIDRLALWQPFATGRSFLESLLRTARFTRLLGETEGAAPSAAVTDRGWTDLSGWVFADEARDQIGLVDLTEAARTAGDALVVAISDTGRPSAEVVAVAEHLGRLGAAGTVRVVRDRAARLFGQHPFQRLADGSGEEDVLRAAFAQVVRETVDWAAAPRPMADRARP